ncbi:MAG: putative Ig domain-containing protein [Candidatus Thalassarchaeaceae archaeon]
MSTQIAIIAQWDYESKELSDNSQRFDSNNAGVSTISLGDNSACAIGTNQKMKCWGDGAFGKTGHGNTEDYGDEESEMGRYLYFTDVGEGITFTDIAIGETFSCALTNDSAIRCWGENDKLGSSAGLSGSGAIGDGYREMGANINVVTIGTWNGTSVEAGSNHACAVVNNGTNDSLVCWGGNSAGQLGLGHTNTIGDDSGDLVGGELPHVDLPDRGPITNIALGNDHTCVLWSDGQIGCWGDNSQGQLGIGNTNTIGDESNEMGSNLVLVDLPSSRSATAITAGNDFTCAILDDSSASCWGDGSNGRLGTGSTGDQGDESDEIGDDLNILNLGTGLGVTSFDAGESHVCAILTNGLLKCWGYNGFGQLGYGDGYDRGDDDNEMGNELESIQLGSGRFATSIQAGNAFTCALLDNAQLKCWGTGADGRTGLELTGAMGEQVNEMGDNLAYVQLFMPLPTFSIECDTQAEGTIAEKKALDSTSSSVGNKVSSTLTSKNCASIAYVDDDSNKLKFGIFHKNKWTIEKVVEWDSGIYDTSIVLDSDDDAHIFFMEEDGPVYSTKIDSVWSYVELDSEWSGTTLSAEIDSSGNFYLFTLTTTEMIIITCLESADCTNSGSWSEVGSRAVNSGGYGLDSDISYDDEIWITYTHVNFHTHVMADTCSNLCYSSLSNWIQKTISIFGNVSSSNASLAIDIGADKSIHIVHNNMTNGLQYSHCETSCTSSSSWSTEEIASEYSTGVVDIATGPDTTVVILAGTPDGEFTLHKKNNQWHYNEVKNIGDSGWMAVEITDLGQMWGFAYYPDDPNPFYLLRQKGMTSSGLNLDIDGDGWSRLEEQNCGTDFKDSTSYPSDTDNDGICEANDGAVTGELSLGESDALSLGEKFGCALLSNNSVACWGDNSEGQLGNTTVGMNVSNYAVMVDFPDGFKATSIDAGAAHACSVGVDFTAVCWGRNTAGELGRGTFSSYESPGHVILPDDQLVRNLAVGTSHNCIKTLEGNLYCWGESDNQRLGRISNVNVQIDNNENFDDITQLGWTGNFWSIETSNGNKILKRDYYNNWRDNSYQLPENTLFLVPGSKIQFEFDAYGFGNNANEWLKVWSGDVLIGTLVDNSSTSWEDNSWLSFDEGKTTITMTVPEDFSDTSGSLRFQVNCYRCQIRIDDLSTKTYAFGSTEDQNTPAKVTLSNTNSISEIALGNRHSCYTLETNYGGDETYCWGYNGGRHFNVLGNPRYNGETSYEPQLVDLSSRRSLISSVWDNYNVDSINAGSDTSCVIMDNLESICWGKSSQTEYNSPSSNVIISDGEYPALMKTGNIWSVAYYDSSSQDLGYAIYDGSVWNTEYVYSGSNDVGNGVSISVNSRNQTNIIAYDFTNDSLVHFNRLTNSTEYTAVDSGNSYFPTTVVGPDGYKHVVYYDNSNRDMKYTFFNGSEWSTPTIIEAGSSSSGIYSGWGIKDLEVDSDGNLHLSYFRWNAGPSNDIIYLKYAKYNGTSWNITQVREIISSGGVSTWVGKLETSLDLDSNNNPHIAYYDSRNSTLNYVYYDGTAWSDTVLTDESYDRGQFGSIGLDSNDYPRIAYFNQSGYNLELAVWNGSSWNFEVVESPANSGTSLGKYCNLEIGSNDLTQISYYGESGHSIKYAINEDDNWNIEEINTFGIQISNNYPLRFGIDNINNPKIAVTDYTGTDNVVVIYKSLGAWNIYEVEDNSGKHSAFPDLHVDSEGTAHVAYVDVNHRYVRYTTVYTDTIWTEETNLIETGDVSGSEPGTSLHFDQNQELNAIYIDGDESKLKQLIVHESGDIKRTVFADRGWYSSMEIDSSGVLHAAYWEYTNSNLVYAKKEGSLWQTTIIDSEGSVGKYPSLVLDNNQMPHISYKDETNDELKYAKYNGSGWEISQIDNNWDTYYNYGNIGETSIGIDSENNPHIAYKVQDGNGNGAWEYFVRYAYYNGSGWELIDVKTQDRTESSWTSYSNTGRDVSIAINSTDSVFIIYFDDYQDDLRVANITGLSLATGRVANNAAGLERSAALTIDSNDSLHVAYYDRSGADLHYAYCSLSCEIEGNWDITTDVDASTNSIGRRVDITVDTDNNPHIAHYDARNDDLEYAYCENTCDNQASWNKTTIESGNNVGYMPSLVLDNDGNKHFIHYNFSSIKVEYSVLYSGINSIYNISSVGSHHYQLGSAVTSSNNFIHLSYYNGSESDGKLQYSNINIITGMWETTVIDETATKIGLYSDIDLDSDGNPHISYFDATNNQIKYAKFDGTSWTITVITTVGSASSHTSIVLDDLDKAHVAYRNSNNGNLEMASWSGSDWAMTTQDNGGTGITDNSGVEINILDGKKYLAFYNGGNDNLEFATAGYYSPLLTGNSVYHHSGTSLDGGSSPVSAIDIGDTHGCAIINNATKCWGIGTFGQLGDNNFGAGSLSPVSVTSISGFIPIEVAVSIEESESSDSGFSCSIYRNLSTDGRYVMCWGHTENGRIGSGSSSGNLGEPSVTNMVKTGESTNLAIVDGSEYHATGPNDVMEVVLNKWVDSGHGCALSYAGHVKCWGYNLYGELGIGNTTTMGDNVNEMGDDLAFVPLGNNRTAKKISVGAYHTCAILDNDSVKCWGYNGHGQLGIGNTTTIGNNLWSMWGDNHPTVDLGTNVTATHITTGVWHTCVITNLGDVKCWGRNNVGQLGLGNTTQIGDESDEIGDNLPSVDLGYGRTAIDIVAGYQSTCVILDSGLVKCWGYNGYNQLGLSNTNNIGDYADEMGNDLAITDLGDNITATSLDSGLYHYCAIINTGDVKCWGYNAYGQLGLGNTTSPWGNVDGHMGDNLPSVDLGSGRTAKQIGVGGYHTCLILDNEDLKCWGHNNQGQLGLGNTNQIGDQLGEMGDNLISPTIPSSYIKSVTSGLRTSCAIIFDDSVRCWGYNGYGQLGLGNTDNIGDGVDEMGSNMQITDINLVVPDTDGDGWIDIWDDDDDNDGYIDFNDDLPLDVRDWIDSDGDGLGNNVDTDDDDPTVKNSEQDTKLTWSDIEEEACRYLPWSSASTPSDYDGDGICDKLDSDIDGNGWENSYQRQCHDVGYSDSWQQTEFYGDSIYDGANYGGYDFVIGDYGIQLFATYYDDYLQHKLLKHWMNLVSSRPSDLYDANGYNHFDVESQNGTLFVANEYRIRQGAILNGSLLSSSNMPEASVMTQSSNGGELTISQDGQMVVRYNTGSGNRVYGSYLNTGINFNFDTPISASGGQMIFGPNGRLHLLQVDLDARNSDLPVGFYHSYADLGNSMSGSTTVDWSEPELILNRNQSTSQYSATDYSDASDYYADLHVSNDGTIYAAMYNTTNLVIGTYDGSSWGSQVIAEATGSNAGVTISSNSTGIPHIAWLNQSSDVLMLSTLEGSDWTNVEVYNASGITSWTYSQTYSKLTLRFNEFDDIFLMSSYGSQPSALIHHKSPLNFPEYSYSPGDSNTDGICDNLQYAVIEYETDRIVFTEGEEDSVTPTFRGQELVEVWAPSLPSGLTINNTTGIISGTPIISDLEGTTYTIYSNSSDSSYPYSLIIYVTSKPSHYAGYGSYYGYQSLSNGIKEMSNAYDSEGNLYYYGHCQYISEWATDGAVDNSFNSCINYYDLIVAKRYSNSTWAWVKHLDCSSGCYEGGLTLDDAGNLYVIGHRNGGDLNLPGDDWDLPSRNAAYTISFDNDGEIRWAKDIYNPSGGYTVFVLGHMYSSSGAGLSQISVNNSTGELTFAGSLYFTTSSMSYRTIRIGDLTYTEDGTYYSYYRPFIVRMNANGNFSWFQSFNSLHGSHNTLEDMVVHDNGTVSILMKAFGNVQLGEHYIADTGNKAILGNINSSGNWTGGIIITSNHEESNLFDNSQTYLMMEKISSGNLIISLLVTDDATEMTINGVSYWLNTTCEYDDLVLFKINKDDYTVQSSREICYLNGALSNGHKGSDMKVDSKDRLWLFVGNHASYYASFHGIIRTDSNLNTDFRENFTHYNNPSSTYQFGWQDVCFDSNDNLKATAYTSSAGLYYGSEYVYYSGSYYYRDLFFMDTVEHTIDGKMPVSGELMRFKIKGLGAIQRGTSDNIDSFAIYPEIPDGLAFNTGNGEITGTPLTNSSMVNYTIWVNDTTFGNHILNISFGIGNGKPTVTYNETEYVFERGTPISPIIPAEINGSIISWQIVPELPEGLELGDDNGTIWGTPTVNLTASTFMLQVSSDGATRNINFNFTINEPIATIEYENGTVTVGRDTVVNVHPTLGGGVVASFGISPSSLPLGLSFDTESGRIYGTPRLTTAGVNYTAWATNSGGTAYTNFTLIVTGSGISLTFPTSTLQLVNGSEMQPFAGQTSGSAPESWNITPYLPNGLEFGENNGTIWGTPENIMNGTIYTIWANTSAGESANAELNISVLLDTDGDGVPDITDFDDDNDGWFDSDEISCGNDPLDHTDVPSDMDNDGICDILDESDDSVIVISYLTDNLNITVNQSFTPLVPVTSGGAITSWEVSPELPSDILLNPSNGIISGMAITTFNATLYTIWANNSAYSDSFDITITSSLLDTDGDGIPDQTDEDDDGDGWLDTEEIICLTDALDETEVPTDSDGDGLCDGQDSINDSQVYLSYGVEQVIYIVNQTTDALHPLVFGGDVVTWEIYPELPDDLIFSNNTGAITGMATSLFESLNITIWANNSLHSSEYVIEILSILLDTDGDGIPDEIDDDDDDDGWLDADEITCLTDTIDETDYPTDNDRDSVCDGLDDVNDSPIYLTYSSIAQNLFVNEPMDVLVATTYGGDVREWEIYPELPEGLYFDKGIAYRSLNSVGTGIISGAPINEFNLSTFTIWANNSQHSDSVVITLRASIADIDDSDFELIYLDDYANLTVDLDYLYLEPMIFGGNVTSWSIVPGMFGGITFNTTNGVISGTPNIDIDLTIFEITASNSIYIDSYNVSIIAQHLDTDLDGIPDYLDEDDDGDGWTDEVEELCGTDSLEFYDFPGDMDSDNLCDFLDDVDDSPILFFYPNDKIVATVGEAIQPIVPIIAPTGGDILNYSVTPQLPEGLGIDNVTGIISGIPLKEFNHLILEYSHTIKATNGQYEFRYTVDFDILPEVINNTDSDEDGWTDADELECGTSPFDSISYPLDIDNDGKCAMIDDDDDGDGRADLIDDFANDSTAWLDTDGDGLPDEVTCQYAVNSAECALMDLIEDDDDDNDGWNDTREIDCSTDPKNSTHIPIDDDDNGICDRLEGVGIENVPKILWICCFPLILLLLLLLWLANPFGINDEEIRGPEPPYTSSSPKIEGGSGEYDDPFILKTIKNVRAGGSVESKELIKITNITPRLEIDFINLSVDDDDGRFNMNNMKANSRGETQFRLQFNDFNMSSENKKYMAFIRVGKASVYFKWEVQVVIPKDLTDEEVEASKIAAMSAAVAAEAERKAAEANAEAERALAEAEREAAIAMETSAAAKAAEEEASAKAAEEEASAKAAEEEAAAKAAEEEAAAKAAEEEAAAKAAAVRANLKAAQEEAVRIAQEEAERALEKMNEEERAAAEKAAAAEEKKRKLLERVAEKAENIDFATIGIAATSDIVSEITTESTSITLSDASSFPDSGNAYIYDPSGNIILKWEGKKDNTLIGVSGITKNPPLGAIIIERDNLQEIKGVGPFIEEKLNALGIYTFRQIANMNFEIEEQVNVAIEFFPGRIRRDEWAKQAYDFINVDES